MQQMRRSDLLTTAPNRFARAWRGYSLRTIAYAVALFGEASDRRARGCEGGEGEAPRGANA